MADLLVAFLLYHFNASYLWWIGYIIVFTIELVQELNHRGYYDNDV
jgi:hypothetical protein